MLRHTSKLKRGFVVTKGILRLLHRNKLNTNKQGRNRLFHVATKIPTQGREVLSRHNRSGSRHNKSGSRHKDEFKAKSLVAIEETCSQQQTSTTPIDYVATSK